MLPSSAARSPNVSVDGTDDPFATPCQNDTKLWSLNFTACAGQDESWPYATVAESTFLLHDGWLFQVGGEEELMSPVWYKSTSVGSFGFDEQAGATSSVMLSSADKIVAPLIGLADWVENFTNDRATKTGACHPWS